MPDCDFDINVTVGDTGQIQFRVPNVTHPCTVRFKINGSSATSGKQIGDVIVVQVSSDRVTVSAPNGTKIVVEGKMECPQEDVAGNPDYKPCGPNKKSAMHTVGSSSGGSGAKADWVRVSWNARKLFFNGSSRKNFVVDSVDSNGGRVFHARKRSRFLGGFNILNYHVGGRVTYTDKPFNYDCPWQTGQSESIKSYILHLLFLSIGIWKVDITAGFRIRPIIGTGLGLGFTYEAITF